MTQKELSYLEDAIGHIDNIIKICNETLKNLSNESLLTFMNNELDNHRNLKEKLLTTLEVKTNE